MGGPRALWNWAGFRVMAAVLMGVVMLGLLFYLSVSVINRRPLGLGGVVSVARAVANSRSVSSYSRGKWTNVIFLHHSTGRNLIQQGQVRERLAAAGYDFWDHDYNSEGLGRPDGSRTDYSYYIPGDNTDPDGLARVFAQAVYRLPLNTFSGLLQHEVIIFKSCFPVSHITSDEQLEQYKSYYLSIRNVMDQHRDKVFIVMTPPPLNPAETDAQAAFRARAFANWLKSGEYLDGHPNVFTFDFFGYLAWDEPGSADNNMLRKAYRDDADSHPNQRANETIGPLFVDFVIAAAQSYRSAVGAAALGQ